MKTVFWIQNLAIYIYKCLCGDSNHRSQECTLIISSYGAAMKTCSDTDFEDYHIYKEIWVPILGEVLQYEKEFT